MNLVSVLIAPAVVQLSIGEDENVGVRLAISLVAVAVIIAAIVIAKRRASTLNDDPAQAHSVARVS
jgi:K(+)-stimulated pyrophosphate-energized sodium pump